jgi:hypothetical protein
MLACHPFVTSDKILPSKRLLAATPLDSAKALCSNSFLFVGG